MNPKPSPAKQPFVQRDAVCDQFEQAWQAEQTPSMEDALSQIAQADQGALIKDLLSIELRYRLARGEQLKMSQYQDRFAEHSNAIKEVFIRMQNAGDTLANKEEAQLFDTTRMGSPTELEATTLQPGTSDSQVIVSLDEIGTDFGDYELLEEVGRGGMGVVYRARQKSMDREVAVKMIIAGSLADEQAIERFYGEAQAVGHLRHPNIVRVFEVGQHKGHHYFSMEFIEGESLDQVAHSRPLTSKEAVGYVQTIAEAIHCAHEAGIIHRDLKPSNILTDSTAQPLITDFGLAKRTEDDSGITSTGKIMGTPSYMPPEQVRAGDNTIGPATDIYALGAILYELLTGRPPFRGESSMETLMQVLEQQPVAPRMLAPQLDHDLETIVLKCLEKDPAQRYESAQSLADELGRYLRGQSIEARSITWMERSWRWCKRRPLIAATGAVFALLLLILSIGGPLMAWNQRVLLFKAKNNATTARSLQRESDDRRDEAIDAKATAEQATANAQKIATAKSHQLYIADLRLAGRYWDSGDTANVLTILERHRADVEQDPIHRFEWHYLDRLCHSELLTLTAENTDTIYSVAVTPDGTHVAGGTRNGIFIWEVDTGKLTMNIKDNPVIFNLTFSPDGQFLAAGGERHTPDGKPLMTLEIWDWQNKKKTQTFTDYPGYDSVVFSNSSYSPDGRLIAYPGRDGTIKVGDVATGKNVASLEGHPKSAQRVAFSSDGKRIVSSDYYSPNNQNVKIWDWAAGKESLTLSVEGYITDVAFGPHGKWLAASAGLSPNSFIRLWKLEDGDKVTLVDVLAGLKRRIRSLAFSPDGNYLTAAGYDNRVAVWQFNDTNPQRIFGGHTADVGDVIFHPDGKRIISCSGDRIKIWDRTQRQGNTPLEAKPNYGGSFAAFSPDGTQIALGIFRGGSHTIGIWDARTQKKITELSGHLDGIRSVMFSPSGKQLVSGSDDGTVCLWDLRTGQTLFTFDDHKDPVLAVAFSPDGNLIASASIDQTARVWNVADGRSISVFRGHTRRELQDLAFSPDGNQVASVGYDNVVRFWDPRSGVELSTLKPKSHDLLLSVAFSPDGRQIVTGGGLGQMVVWDIATGKELFIIKAHEDQLKDLAFSPDGRRLASCSWDNLVHLWDTATWQKTITLQEHNTAVYVVRFSPDGKWLLSDGPVTMLRDGRPR